MHVLSTSLCELKTDAGPPVTLNQSIRPPWITLTSPAATTDSSVIPHVSSVSTRISAHLLRTLSGSSWSSPSGSPPRWWWCSRCPSLSGGRERRKTGCASVPPGWSSACRTAGRRRWEEVAFLLHRCSPFPGVMWLLLISVNIMLSINYCTLLHLPHTACTHSTLISWKRLTTLSIYTGEDRPSSPARARKRFCFGLKWRLFLSQVFIYVIHCRLQKDLNKSAGFN